MIKWFVNNIKLPNSCVLIVNFRSLDELFPPLKFEGDNMDYFQGSNQNNFCTPKISNVKVTIEPTIVIVSHMECRYLLI